MRSLAIPCVALAALGLATPALAESDSQVGAPPVIAPMSRPMPVMPPQMHGQRRMVVEPYRRPFFGYRLPRQWVAPSYYIVNFGSYGLARPARGFGWSRYHGDAVLTDSWGRVYAWHEGMDWERGGGDRGPRYEGRRDGTGGAIAGAVIGGVAGNVIAGRGNRTAGTLIGAGVGALAGMAIDRAEDRAGHHGGDRDDGGYEHDGYGEGYSHWQSGGHGGSYAYGYDAGSTVVTTVVVKHAAASCHVCYEERVVHGPRRIIKHQRRILKGQ